MATPLAPRGAFGFAGAVFAGAVSAAIFAVAANHADTLLFFLIYLASLPLFMAGLGAGMVAGLVAELTGIGGLLAASPSNYAVLYTFIYAIPAVILMALALRQRTGTDQKPAWYPEGNLLTAMVIYPCALFLFFVALSTSHPGGLLALTTQMVNEMTEPMKTQMDAATAEQITAMMEKLVVFMPAILGICWAFVILICMVVAQSFLQKQNWNLRPNFALKDLTIPNWLIFAVAITGLMGAGTPLPFSYIGANLSLMLGLPFVFVGLAVVHSWAALQKASTAILVVFYIFLSIIPVAALLVALLGVVDQWANFRQRFNQKPRST